MLRIAIVDDELSIAENIAKKTKEHAEQLHISVTLAIYNKGYDFLNQYHPGDFDVIFLDIDMPELNGDELSAMLSKIDPVLLLVYVTNYCNDEVYTMLKYMPIGFIRKPFFEKEIEAMLAILNEKITSLHKTYTIVSGQNSLQISLMDVVYIESAKHYLYFHKFADILNTKEEIIKIRMKLDELENDIEPYGFIRIHSSILVNYRWIRSIQKNMIILDSGESLPISRNHEIEVMQKFMFFSRR